LRRAISSQSLRRKRNTHFGGLRIHGWPSIGASASEIENRPEAHLRQAAASTSKPVAPQRSTPRENTLELVDGSSIRMTSLSSRPDPSWPSTDRGAWPPRRPHGKSCLANVRTNAEALRPAPFDEFCKKPGPIINRAGAGALPLRPSLRIHLHPSYTEVPPPQDPRQGPMTFVTAEP